MGACGSKPKVTEDLKSKNIKHHRRKRRRILRRRVSSHKIEANIAHSNPAFQVSNRASGYCNFIFIFFLLMFDL